MLIDYLPPIVQRIKEMNAICDAEQPFFDKAEQEIEKILNRAFILSADEIGIERFERICGITPTSEQTLEERRITALLKIAKKILNRTRVVNLLCNYSESIKIHCDYDNDILIVEIDEDINTIKKTYAILDEMIALNIYIAFVVHDSKGNGLFLDGSKLLDGNRLLDVVIDVPIVDVIPQN